MKTLSETAKREILEAVGGIDALALAVNCAVETMAEQAGVTPDELRDYLASDDASQSAQAKLVNLTKHGLVNFDMKALADKLA